MNAVVSKITVIAILLAVFAGCQQVPTKALEETSNIFAEETVLVDTRSSFLFTSSHLQGSINLVTDEFLIKKNPKMKKYSIDPDFPQIIERLARRGIHPSKKIMLLGEAKNSAENLKWTWLLKLLGVDKIQIFSQNDFRKAHPNARYKDPDRAEPWILDLSPELQQEFILNKAPDCFVSWIAKKCSS